MGFFSRKKPEMKTQVIEDPYKIPVSSPLSSYFSTQVGKGLPRYGEQTGKALYEPIDTSAYSKFLSIDPGEWYTKAIQEPTLKAAREETPFIEEGWAGSLRGSGRFRDVEDYWSDVSETLAQGRYRAELEIPQAQYKVAESYAQQRTRQMQLEYMDWFKSLPEMNPNLDRALQFLAGPSGRDVITYVDPGYRSMMENIFLPAAYFVSNQQWGKTGSSSQGGSSTTIQGGVGGRYNYSSQYGKTWSPYKS